MRFYNYRDAVVRTHVKNIVGSVLKCRSEDGGRVAHYFGTFPFVVYFVHQSCYLKDMWQSLDQEIRVQKLL